MEARRDVVVVAVAAVLAVLAMPVSAMGATQPTQESYRISGVMADAKWLNDAARLAVPPAIGAVP